jgi:hypothetical protein
MKANILVKTVGIIIVISTSAGLSDAGEKEKNESYRVIGELKSQKNTPDGNNTLIEVLAPGEEKPRRYFVLYDPKINGPIVAVLRAVRAAHVGDTVELEWVKTGHGPAIKTFQVFKKAASKRVQALLKERLATLKELAAVSKRSYVEGRTTVAEIARINRLLLKAELELCESNQERIAVHERAVALAKECERIAGLRVTAGTDGQASVLTARAERLSAEIALERAKGRQAVNQK